MKRLAIFAGVVLVLLGALGFVPQLSPDGQLFGVVALEDVHKYLMIGVGLALVAIGLVRRRQLPPPSGPGDMRNLTWQ